MRSTALRALLCGTGLLLALAGATAVPAEGPSDAKPPADKPESQRAQSPRVAMTISKETTCITRPLKSDGYPHYAAAINQRFGPGVTPEDNAAVPFCRAVGPGEIIEEDREEYFRILGIPPLPEKGDYFIDFEHYVALKEGGPKPDGAARGADAADDAWEQFGQRRRSPWSQRQFPVVAEWLAANEKPLALVVEASKRPRRFDPLVASEKTPLMAIPLPVPAGAFRFCRALTARAMLRLNEGKVDEAWENLLTCHRLARLIGQGPMQGEASAGQGLDLNACDADQALPQHARLTAAQVARMRADLDRLPPMPSTADKLDVAERFSYLDAVLVAARDAPASLAQFERFAAMEVTGGSKELQNTVRSLVRHSATAEIDWDIPLRMGNAWFDRIADACRKPTRAERREALKKLDEDFRRLKTTAEDVASLEKAMAANPRRALSERAGQVLLALFAPRTTLHVDNEDRALMRFELDKLAFALAAHRADRGSFPARLADLVPEYVAHVPKDLFSDADLHYRRERDGFVLYSVGVNRRDDGAKSYEDRTRHLTLEESVKRGEDWDDLVVRVPAPR